MQVSKQALRSIAYKLTQLQKKAYAEIKGHISGEVQVVAAGLFKRCLDFHYKIIDFTDNNDLVGVKTHLRLLFETNCLFNYLMLEKEEVPVYINFSKLTSYRDLVLNIHYGFLTPNTIAADKITPLSQTLDKLKAEIISSGILASVGKHANALEPENIDNLANLPSSFKSVHAIKRALEGNPQYSAIDAMYQAMYNIPSQTIHSHWYDVSEGIFSPATFYTKTFVFRQLVVSLLSQIEALKKAEMLDLTFSKQIIQECAFGILNTIRIAEGDSPMSMADAEKLTLPVALMRSKTTT